MTAKEKRELLVQQALTRKEKNQYSQEASKRTKIESGWGDCSGTIWYWYNKLFGMNIGSNTEAQINSAAGERISLKITEGIPDETMMRKGDLLYFRGTDNSRTEGVGHVEMYIGNNQLFGHGSGLGGTVKNMAAYCKQRQAQTSTAKLKNRGLICVKRFIPDDEEEIDMEEIKKLQEQVQALTNTVEALKAQLPKVYHYTVDVPAWGRATVQKLLDKGILAGAAADDLNLSEDLLRTLVVNDRAGIYD